MRLFVGLIIGLTIGIVGGLFYAWRLDPRIEYDTKPWQLTGEGQRQYIIAVSLAWAKEGDTLRAGNRLGDLQLGDKTWQVLADTACELVRTGYGSTNRGLQEIRSMVELARSQGATGCADSFISATSTPAPIPTVPTATPTLIPPATKTPQPTIGPTFTPATPDFPTLTPASAEYKLALIEPFCNGKLPGRIEVNVQDAAGNGIPGVMVEVSTITDKDAFFTGLKPERGAGFADFQMAAAGSYVVTLPGLGERSRALDAVQCNVAQKDGGGKAVVSYRVIFRKASTS